MGGGLSVYLLIAFKSSFSLYLFIFDFDFDQRRISHLLKAKRQVLQRNQSSIEFTDEYLCSVYKYQDDKSIYNDDACCKKGVERCTKEGEGKNAKAVCETIAECPEGSSNCHPGTWNLVCCPNELGCGPVKDRIRNCGGDPKTAECPEGSYKCPRESADYQYACCPDGTECHNFFKG